MQPITQDELEAAADALRRLEQAGKRLRDWRDLPKATQAKWTLKALCVIEAILREQRRGWEDQ